MNEPRPRQAWLTLHRWLGFGLLLLLLPAALSGVALVVGSAAEPLLHPQRHATSGPQLLPPDAYAVAARLGPADRVAKLRLPTGAGPVVATIETASEAGGVRLVYLDPPTAHVLDTAGADGPALFLRDMHASLRLGDVGRITVGGLGLGLLLLSVSGLRLWWPVAGSRLRGLRWRRRPEWSANLHHLLGFWAALPLGLVAVTGMWLAFVPVGDDARPPPVAHAAARTGLSAQEAAVRALRVAPGPVRTIIWPTDRKPDWRVELAGAVPVVLVADDGAVAVPASPHVGEGRVAHWMRRLHDGDGVGPLWRALLAVTGLAAVLLAITGAAMRRSG